MTGRSDPHPPIQEDMRFQRRTWMVERAGWVVLALIVVAAGLGLLSHGPLSETTAENAGVVLSYERLERRAATSRFTLNIPAVADRQDVLVRFHPDFLRSYELRVVTPHPVSSAAGTNGFEAVFKMPAQGDLTIHISARAHRFGFADVTIEIPGRATLVARQFIYP
jgi:hypothetical protein